MDNKFTVVSFKNGKFSGDHTVGSFEEALEDVKTLKKIYKNDTFVIENQDGTIVEVIK